MVMSRESIHITGAPEQVGHGLVQHLFIELLTEPDGRKDFLEDREYFLARFDLLPAEFEALMHFDATLMLRRVAECLGQIPPTTPPRTA